MVQQTHHFLQCSLSEQKNHQVWAQPWKKIKVYAWLECIRIWYYGANNRRTNKTIWKGSFNCIYKEKVVWLQIISLFGWDYSLVNDRKFRAGTLFFFHTKPASKTSLRSSNEQAQPNEQAECGLYRWIGIFLEQKIDIQPEIQHLSK